MHKQTDVNRHLLSHGALLDRGVTIVVVRLADLSVIQILLEHGWDVNSPLVWGHTALPSCLRNEPLAKLLLVCGANPNLGPPQYPQPDSQPITNSDAALETAACFHAPAMIDLLGLGRRIEKQHTIARCCC